MDPEQTPSVTGPNDLPNIYPHASSGLKLHQSKFTLKRSNQHSRTSIDEV